MPNTRRKERQALPAAASLQLNGQSDAACQVVYRRLLHLSTATASIPMAQSEVTFGSLLMSNLPSPGGHGMLPALA